MTAPIILSGMHRSGTSLLASMFREAGVHLRPPEHPSIDLPDKLRL